MQKLFFKNKKILSLLFAATIMLFAVVSAIFCMCLSTEYLTIDGDNYSSAEIFADDDLSGIRVAKTSLNKKSYADFMAENNVDEIYSSDKNFKLTADNAEEELEKLGYTIYDKGDDYLIYTQFFLKRLMVSGDYTNCYDAIKVVKGTYYDTLCYESEQATANAYYNLLNENGVEVMQDALITVTDDESDSTTTTTHTTHDYSVYKTWGAEAMDVVSYNEYLESANVNKQVAVVVIDTGINTSHEMFADRLIYENDKIVGESICDSTYTYSGYTFEDDTGHGTHVSGIIAGLTPQNVKIIPIKVINYYGGTVDYFYTALQDVIDVYSKKYNIVAVNMSLSLDLNGFSKTQFNAYYNSFVNYFSQLRNENILPVVAAGNDAELINGTYFKNGKLPSKCENAVVVTALKQTTKSGKTAYTFDTSYSNYGSQVDFSAPGTKITSAYISSTNSAGKSEYAELSGTSMATPHVAAAIALLCLDEYYWNNDEPNYTADTIEEDLRNYTVKINGKEFDNYYGYGMVNFAYFEGKTKTDLTITLNEQSGVYGDKINLDNTAYTVSDSTVDLSGLELALTTDATNTSPVGEYNLTATVKKNPVYLVITFVNSKYTVTQREVAISLQNQTGYYGDNPTLDQTKFTTTQGSIVNGDEKDLRIYTYADGSTRGSFPLYYALNNANYIVKSGDGNSAVSGENDAIESDGTVEYSSSAFYTVQARVIDVELEEQFSYFGDQVLFNQTLYSIKSGTIVNGDNVEFTLLTDAKTGDNAGEYKITVVCNDENYTVTYNDCYYKILPIQLTVKIFDQQIEYSKQIEISSTAYEIVDGGDLQISGITLTTRQTEYDSSQTYTIYGENSNTNYDITFINGKLTFIVTDIGGEDNLPTDNNGEDNLNNGDGAGDSNNGETTDNSGENGGDAENNSSENNGETPDNSGENVDNNTPNGDGKDNDNVINDNKNEQNSGENLQETPDNLQENPDNLQENPDDLQKNDENDAENNSVKNGDDSQNSEVDNNQGGEVDDNKNTEQGEESSDNSEQGGGEDLSNGEQGEVDDNNQSGEVDDNKNTEQGEEGSDGNLPDEDKDTDENIDKNTEDITDKNAQDNEQSGEQNTDKNDEQSGNNSGKENNESSGENGGSNGANDNDVTSGKEDLSGKDDLSNKDDLNNNEAADEKNNESGDEKGDSADKESGDEKGDSADKESGEEKESSGGNVFNIYINGGTGCASTTTGGDYIMLGLAALVMIAVIVISARRRKAK